MPLVIGMVTCALLLGAGIVAATSAFTSRSALQHTCDGAAAAAAHALPLATGGDAVTHSRRVDESAILDAAYQYTQVRDASVSLEVAAESDRLAVHCAASVPILFGAVFGSPTRDISVRAFAQAATLAAGQ